MTRRILRNSIFKSAISILCFSHAVRATCDICPNGVENPTSQVSYSGGTVSCSDAATIFSPYDPISCVVTRVDVVPTCCPSQFQQIADSNVCGWCESGATIETLGATFPGPMAGMPDATCADLIPG